MFCAGKGPALYNEPRPLLLLAGPLALLCLCVLLLGSEKQRQECTHRERERENARNEPLSSVAQALTALASTHIKTTAKEREREREKKKVYFSIQAVCTAGMPICLDLR